MSSNKNQEPIGATSSNYYEESGCDDSFLSFDGEQEFLETPPTTSFRGHNKNDSGINTNRVTASKSRKVLHERYGEFPDTPPGTKQSRTPRRMSFSGSDPQMEARKPDSEVQQQEIQENVQNFVAELADSLKAMPVPSKATNLASQSEIAKAPSYDPNNAKNKEFYGDVQKTVNMLAQTIEEMPVPSEKVKKELVEGLVPLYDHQQYGLKWLSWREGVFPGGGILADEMGLGKTIMMIALMMKSKNEGSEDELTVTPETRRLIFSQTTLVVCPVGCMLQWQDEIKSKGKGLRVYVYHGSAKTTSPTTLTNHDVVITTYDTIAHDITKPEDFSSRSPLCKLYWKRIVLDEAHNIRNFKTHRAMSICRLSARHRWAVTGTPVHNNPGDLFSIVKFLRMTPFDEPKVWEFWIGMKIVSKITKAQERLETIGKALILRRTKTEVESMGGNVKSIPPKTVEIIELELSPEEKRVYEHLTLYAQIMLRKFMMNKEEREDQMQAAANAYTASQHKQTGEGVPTDVKFSHLFALICRLRQCAVLPHLIETMLEQEEVDEDDSFDEYKDEHLISKRNPVLHREYESTKVKRILNDLEELRAAAKAEGRHMDKVVIVSSWPSFLLILNEHLRARRFTAVFITGKEKPEERMSGMKRFNKLSGKPQIVLLSLAAGGVGINLIGGNYVFFVEPHWNPQLELQAQDRVHRFGQTKNVYVRRYIVQNTIETRVTDLQNQKLELADGILNNTKNGKGAGLSLANIRRLFQ
ncbi:unnamed protein product [Orchesella dallaii]|uniref:Transcription termination factor 2 n=1 Tax=Orchesella dallaii TaxID=48710 RepID=A0ABP1R5U3_9HEXA